MIDSFLIGDTLVFNCPLRFDKDFKQIYFFSFQIFNINKINKLEKETAILKSSVEKMKGLYDELQELVSTNAEEFRTIKKNTKKNVSKAICAFSSLNHPFLIYR